MPERHGGPDAASISGCSNVIWDLSSQCIDMCIGSHYDINKQIWETTVGNLKQQTFSGG